MTGYPTRRGARGLLLAVLAVGGIALLSRMAVGGKSPDERRYDVLRYALDLSLDPEASTVSGSVELTIDAPTRPRSVRLDADSSTIRIDSVLIDGRFATFSREGNVLDVPLPRGDARSSTFTVTVHYLARSNYDGRYDDGGILFTRTATGYTVGTISQPNFARRWWPCNDRPSDKAFVSLRCSAPAGMTVVSNGRMVSKERSGGRDIFTWATKNPIATYLVFLGAADYLVTRDSLALPGGGGVELALYVFPEDSARAAEDFRNAKEILTYFSETFLPYPFADEQFAVAEVDGRLTMENQTVVTVERGLVTGDRRNENTFVHETAHQWWGDYITPVDWHHTWLNEGFATYAEALYIESRRGAASYRQYVDVLMDQPPGFYAGSVIGRDEDAFWDSFGPAVYYKGALTLHMLRRMMGDSVFFTAMRAYLRDPRLAYGNASTEDFRAACETAYGASLDWFFRQWIHTARDSADRPVLRCRWAPDGAGTAIRVTVNQVSPGDAPWRLPFRFRVHSAAGTEDFAVVDSLSRQEFLLTPSAPADSVVVDPDRDLFMVARWEAAQ